MAKTKFMMGGWLTWLIGSALPIFIAVAAFHPTYGDLDAPWNFIIGIGMILIALSMWNKSRKLYKISKSLDEHI